MDNFFKWIIKHPLITIGSISIFVAFVIPFVIHIVFIFEAPRPFLVARWDCGSVLGYYGSVLGFLGTAIFSMLALYQTQKIKEESDKNEKLLQMMEERRTNPVFSCEISGYSGNNVDLWVTLSNYSNNSAWILNVSNFEIKNSNGEILMQSEEVLYEPKYVKAASEVKIKFKNSPIKESDVKLEFYFSCLNQSGNKIKYLATTYIDDYKKSITQLMMDIKQID